MSIERQDDLPSEPSSLDVEESSLKEKLKTILDVLRPHEGSDTFYKLAGSYVAACGAEVSRIAFLHPEQMNIMGRELTSSETSWTRTLGVLMALGGGLIISEGIRKAKKIIDAEENS